MSERFGKEWLYFLMEGQSVTRFHSRPFLKPVNDAHHSHGVAMLCYPLTNGAPSANLLMAALTHDMGEQAASDISSPAKRALNISESLHAYEQSVLSNNGMNFHHLLTDEEKHILNLADQFEGMLECVRERFYGNRYVNICYWKWYGWANETPLNHAASLLLVNIHAMWCWADSGEAPLFDVFAQGALSNG